MSGKKTGFRMPRNVPAVSCNLVLLKDYCYRAYFKEFSVVGHISPIRRLKAAKIITLICKI